MWMTLLNIVTRSLINKIKIMMCKKKFIFQILHLCIHAISFIAFEVCILSVHIFPWNLTLLLDPQKPIARWQSYYLVFITVIQIQGETRKYAKTVVENCWIYKK